MHLHLYLVIVLLTTTMMLASAATATALSTVSIDKYLHAVKTITTSNHSSSSGNNIQLSFSDSDGPTAVTRIQLDMTINVSGFDRLTVTSLRKNSKKEENDQFTTAQHLFFMGYSEAYWNWEAALSYNYSLAEPQPIASQPGGLLVKTWLNDNIAFMQNLPEDDPAFQFLQMMAGMAHGINDAIDNNAKSGDKVQKWTLFDVVLINAQTDLYDLLTSMLPGDDHELLQSTAWRRNAFMSHCSALVRLTSNSKSNSNNEDLLVGHATWNSYSSMGGRMMKTYNFPQQSVTFSGYQLVISSLDDFYVTGSKLVVTETSFNNYNATLTRMYTKADSTLLEGVRIMISLTAAADCESWATKFLDRNSGSYNNEYMCVDLKKIPPNNNNEPLPAGTFWVLDQMPGPYSVYRDMTDFLNTNKYFPSYNIPFFPEVQDRAGYTSRAKQRGNFYSHEHCARANIFRRDAPKVDDIASFKALLRYNDWKTDPLSVIPNCTACNPSTNAHQSIANRADLVPLDASYAGLVDEAEMAGAYSFGVWGALDAKIVAYSQQPEQQQQTTWNLTLNVVFGPTNERQPTFSWSALEAALPPAVKEQQALMLRHRGSPNVFNFPFSVVTAANQYGPSPSDSTTTTATTHLMSSTTSSAATTTTATGTVHPSTTAVPIHTTATTTSAPAHNSNHSGGNEQNKTTNNNNDGGGSSEKEYIVLGVLLGGCPLLFAIIICCFKWQARKAQRLMEENGGVPSGAYSSYQNSILAGGSDLGSHSRLSDRSGRSKRDHHHHHHQQQQNPELQSAHHQGNQLQDAAGASGSYGTMA